MTLFTFNDLRSHRRSLATSFPSWGWWEHIRIWVCCGVVLLAGATPAECADDPSPKPSWQVGESVNFSSGTYGTALRTTTVSVPLVQRRLFTKGDLAVVIPYVMITSNCGVTFVGGVPLQTGGICATPSGKFAQRVTNSGLGDVLLRGRYYVVNESAFMPSVGVTARVKAPTADREKGLGTGEWDEGVGVSLRKQIFGSFLLFLNGGYTIIGKPPGAELRNRWSYDVGLGYAFTPTLLGSLYYEEARALVSGLQNPRDVLTALSWALTPSLRFNTAVEIGLSSGAPQYGLTVGASFRF